MSSHAHPAGSLASLLLLAGVGTLLLSWPSGKATAQSLATDGNVECTVYTPTNLGSGSKPNQALCRFSKDLSGQCTSLPRNSIFSLCNVYDLSIGAAETYVDENGRSYQGITLKTAERNSCLADESSFWAWVQCDTFAVYTRILRREEDQACLALVASALLGTQEASAVTRSSINLPVESLQIPGISRRIIFTPASDARLQGQSAMAMVRTARSGRQISRAGSAVSPLYLLGLESTLTTASDNLKPNPARLRVVRSSVDYSDFSLGKNQEIALNKILSGCR